MTKSELEVVKLGARRATKRLTHPTVSYTGSKLGARRATKSELEVGV